MIKGAYKMFHGSNGLEEGQISIRTKPRLGHILQQWERFSGELGTNSSYQCRPSTSGIHHEAAIVRLRRLNLKGSGSGGWLSKHDFFLGDTTPETIGHLDLSA